MSTDNPYAFNPLDVSKEDPSDHPDFGRVLRALSETRPWVIMLGTTLVLAPFLLFIGGAIMSPGLFYPGARRNTSFLQFTRLCNLGMSIVSYWLIGFQLLSYASLLRKAEVTLSMNAVAAALEKQKTLWKYAALFVISTLLLTIMPLLSVIAELLLR
jgi:hypothetical protein